MYRVFVKSYTRTLIKNNSEWCLSCIATKRVESTQTSRQEAYKNAAKELQSENITDFDGHEINSTKVRRTKIPAKTPIVKGFFTGKIDKELIPFPEVIERDDMTKLYEDIKHVRKYFKESIDADAINKTWNIPEKIIQDLKELGYFGLNVEQDYQGNGYTISESLIATEHEDVSPDLGSLLISHRAVVDAINELGTESQKQKYLPKLASGSLIATSAIYEPILAENELFNTKAFYETVDDKWILNGEKIQVINGIGANLYMVIAQTKNLTIAGDAGIGITIFLVDDSMPGVEKSKDIHSFGLKASKICNLKFNKVILSPDNVLGTANDGNSVAQKYLKYFRLRSSLQNFGLMKQIIKHMTEFCINNKQMGVSFQELEMNGKRLGNAISSAYAVESMIYYTAGLMDEFENPDVDVECAIIKLLSIEKLWSIVKSSLEFLGPTSLLSGAVPESVLRNTAQLYTGGETIDSMLSFIALSGLQQAGTSIYEDVKKQRNPLFHPGHIFSKFFEKHSIDEPKTNLNLDHELHQSLMLAAKCLERSIGRLQICTNLLLTRHGQDILQKQSELRRLAEIAVQLYAMFASLSRSSRSYCIGLQNADYEMLLATIFCSNAHDYVKILATELLHGEFVNNDRNYKRLSKQIYKSRGYFSEHPLKYNF